MPQPAAIAFMDRLFWGENARGPRVAGEDQSSPLVLPAAQHCQVDLAEVDDGASWRFAASHEVGAIACSLIPDSAMVEAEAALWLPLGENSPDLVVIGPDAAPLPRNTDGCFPGFFVALSERPAALPHFLCEELQLAESGEAPVMKQLHSFVRGDRLRDRGHR